METVTDMLPNKAQAPLSSLNTGPRINSGVNWNLKPQTSSGQRVKCTGCNLTFHNAKKMRRHARWAHELNSHPSSKEVDNKPTTDRSSPSSDMEISEEEINFDDQQETKDRSCSTDFYCEICDLYVASAELLRMHLMGGLHRKAAKAAQEGRLPPKKVLQRMQDSGKLQELADQDPRYKKWANLNISYKLMEVIWNKPANEPALGLTFLTELDGEVYTHFLCKLCDARCDMSNVISHVIGVKHRKEFLVQELLIFLPAEQNKTQIIPQTSL